MATPQGFRPSLSPQQVKDYRRLYDQQPDKFNDQTVEALKQHAEYYKLPFAESDYSFAGKIKGIMGQAGAGFWEGFTTLRTNDPPKDDAEAIARNIGHLAGFVGYMPSAPLKAIGAIKLAKAAQYVKGRSMPMLAAKYAEKGVKKIVNPIYGRAIEARVAAGKTATGFLQNNVVQDLASGAFHLGVASSVSSWQGGVDEMMDSFKHGAVTGAAFRGIGNLVQTGSSKADMALRTLSASLMTGLPSTMRGETTPMQIYQYLLGAYFGKNEMPVHRRMGQKHLVKMMKATDPITGVKGVTDPALVEGWSRIDKPGQDWVIKKVKRAQDPVNQLAAKIVASVKGIDPEVAKIEAQKIIDREKELTSISFTEEGEPLRDLTKEELKEMEEGRGDVDPQIIPARLSVNAKSFVDINMGEFLSNKSTGEKLYVASELNTKWLELLKKGRKDGVNPAQEMIDHISEKHDGFSQKPEDRAFWKGLGFTRIKQQPMTQLTITNGNPRVMVSDYTGTSINDAGNRKQMSSEPKLIENIFLQDFNKKYNLIGTKEEIKIPRGGLAFLDHMVKYTPTGPKEFELSKYPDYLAQLQAAKDGRAWANKEDIAVANQRYYTELGKLMKFMNEKNRNLLDKQGNQKFDKRGNPIKIQNNMYYYGGRGDAQRMYFVKYHPDVPFGRKGIKKTIEYIKNEMRKAGVSKEQIEEIDKSRIEYIKRYGKGIGAQTTGDLTARAEITGKDGKKRIIELTPEEAKEASAWEKAMASPVGKYGAGEYMAFKNKLLDKYDSRTTPSKKPTPEEKLSHYFEGERLSLEVKDTRSKNDNLATEMFDKALISNAIYDARMNGFRGLEDIGKVLNLGKGKYINNAKDFNKRSQVWLTSGYSSDPKIVTEIITELRKERGFGKTDVIDENLNIKLVEDTGKEGTLVLKTPNSQHFQVTDGGILGRSDVIDALNRQAGLPEDGGVNKSFIVSPDPQNGALLGKYMIHSVTPKMEKYMQKNNIHFIIPRSAAKQIGERNVGKLEWHRRQPVVNADTYKLPIKDIKVVMSEKTDKKSLKPQNMPKQMFTNFTPFSFFDKDKVPFKNEKEYNEAMDTIFSDMYSTLSGSRVKGNEELNSLVDKLVHNPSAYESDIPKIINNLEKVGVHELLRAIQAKGNEKFANAAYLKIQKINRDIFEEMRADGEYTDYQIEQMKSEMSDFETVHERIMKLMPESLAGHLHKFSRDYRMAVIRNYIVNGITRPQIGNSGSTRMRPYEIGMSKEGETKRLEKEDDIFFLDDGFQNMMVDVTGIGRAGKAKLGELFREHKSNPGDKQLEELLRAVVVRVPMDSMSGAHVLKFAGFTGVRGYGSLLHGRTMEALGGADLDGDKAFVFFGGRSPDGKGEGFKKEWKDAYDWSKNEFVAQKGVLKPLQLRKVISGFQIHADLQGVKAAKEEGYETGGTTPADFLSKADSGRGETLHPEYASLYGAKAITPEETKAYTGREKKYGPRTEQNVINSDGTVLFGDVTSFGSRLTVNLLKAHQKPYIINPDSAKLREWLGEQGIEVLNVAGNARSPAGKQAYEVIKGLKGVKEEVGSSEKYEEHNKDTVNPLNPEGLTYRQELTEQGVIKDQLENPALQYSPFHRQVASDAASGGRNMLGIGVTQTSYVRSAYSAIRSMKNSETYVDVFHKDYVYKSGPRIGQMIPMKMRVRARKGDKYLRSFRGVSRAAVGVASDPMNEAGLNFGKYGEKLLEKQVDALFEYQIVDSKGKPDFRKNKMIHTGHKKKAIYNTVKNINQAVYGRNWAENRRFQMWEIQGKLNGLDDPVSGIPMENRNTFLPKVGTDLKGLDWSDGILKRLDHSKILEIYDNHRLSLEEWDALGEVLGRESMAVPESKHVNLVMRHKLHTRDGMEEQLNINNPNYNKDIFKGFKIQPEEFPPEHPQHLAQRRYYLNDIVKKAEDFIVNDFSDIASMKVLQKLSKNIEPSRVRELSELADSLKKASHVMANKAKAVNRDNSTLDPLALEYIRQVEEALNESLVFGEKQSSALNQLEIDSRIKQLKKGSEDRAPLTTEEAALFDSLMLSTLWRGRTPDLEAQSKRILAKIKKDGDLDESTKVDLEREIKDMTESSKKTTLARVGYASEAIPDTSVRRMLVEYQKLFDYTTEKAGSDEQMIEIAKKVAVEDPEVVGLNKKRLDEFEPFIGLHEGKLSKEEAELGHSIIGHLKHYNNINSVDLNGLTRWLLKKDLNAMSLEDFETLDRWFKMTRDGTWWQRIMRPVKGEFPTLSRWHHLMFPKAVGQDLMRYDLKLFEARGHYKKKGGEWEKGRVVQPENMMSKMQNAVHTMNQQSTQLYEEQKRKFDEELIPFLEGVSDGDKLFRIAVREREFKHMPQKISGESNAALYNIKSREYINRWNEIQKEYDWPNLQNKEYSVTIGKETVKMNGREIVSRINEILTSWNKKIHGWMTGGRDEEVGILSEWDRLYEPMKEGQGTEANYYIVERFLDKFDKSILKGDRLDLTEGIDGLREISKSQMIAYFKKADADVKEAIQENLLIGKTGDLGPKGYWPHVAGDAKVAAAGLKEAIKTLNRDVSLTKKERDKEMAKLIYHYRQITGDWAPTAELNDKYNLTSDILQSIAEKKTRRAENLKGRLYKNRMVSSQHKRDAHIPGWSVEPEVYSQYMKSVIDNMYQHAAQIKVRADIHKFRNEFWKKTKDNELTNNWVNYFNLYAQDALGYPSDVPDHILNNSGMKIKGTPYAWWNDNNVKNRINQIRAKLGIGKQRDAELPEELRGIDFGNLARWGNIEAKYQLATLLAHPKSAVANLYGGTAHTLISTGMGNFRNARSIEYLKTNVNSEWNNMADVEKWVQGLGVVEDFIIYEAGLNPQFKSKRFKEFLSEATSAFKKDSNLSDKSLKSIANKHGIIDSVFNKAAWFMRRPERTLRRDAFMAHYLQARDNFEGAIRRFDDPVLIKLGMEGVKSTQFLYSAPFRPAFARSAMGKVMTRFQLWAWNSVRFRNETIREAHLRGWKEGTPEFERFKRMATMDLLMFGLGNVFMYSLFENALPQPYSWIQDWADWAFGNEKERSRAFFGTYPEALLPLQMITPPIARILPATFKAVINDDYSRLGGYYAWSMVPFGRMGYDVLGNVFEGGKGGLIENPSRAIEKISGIPYQQFSRQVKKYKDEEFIHPRIL